MNDELFEWDDGNILHLAEHEVTPEEAEEVILGEPIEAGFEVVEGEDRWSYVGETNEGRIIRVVIALRAQRMRVITGFEPGRHWKVFYLEQRAAKQ